jgi:hypothetical protein
LFGVIVILRLILPFVVLHFANNTLAHLKGYYGHINDIDIALIRGAYVIDSMYLNKVDTITNKQTPFFSAKTVDLSIEWRAIFHGQIVGEMVFEQPSVKFTKDKVEPKNLRKDSSTFKSLKNKFMPLVVNRFEVNDGQIHFIDEGTTPKVDIMMQNTYVLAQNLRNSYDSATLLPATVYASALIYGGNLKFNMKLNPLAEEPTFDLNAELTNTKLVELNQFLQAYAKVDVNKGTFGLYTEAAAKNGKFAGYVKPVIKDLDVLGHEDRKDNLLQKIWEGLVGTAADVFKNHPKDQFATKVPFEGDLRHPDTGVWDGVVNILRNAFVHALQPAIDADINIQSVGKEQKDKRGFFKKLFSKKEKK